MYKSPIKHLMLYRDLGKSMEAQKLLYLEIPLLLSAIIMVNDCVHFNVYMLFCHTLCPMQSGTIKYIIITL